MKDARVVEAIRKEYSVGLQLLARFKVGDAVSHINVGDGVVTHADGKTVEVTYQQKFKDGQSMRGCYDVLWFDCNPKHLFHRGTEPLSKG